MYASSFSIISVVIDAGISELVVAMKPKSFGSSASWSTS